MTGSLTWAWITVLGSVACGRSGSAVRRSSPRSSCPPTWPPMPAVSGCTRRCWMPRCTRPRWIPCLAACSCRSAGPASSCTPAAPPHCGSGSNTGPQPGQITLQLADATGEPVATVHALATRPVTAARLRDDLAAGGHQSLWQVSWTEQPAGPVPAPAAHAAIIGISDLDLALPEARRAPGPPPRPRCPDRRTQPRLTPARPDHRPVHHHRPAW